MTGAPRPICLRLLLLPVVSAQPECSSENISGQVTVPLNTFSWLPFSARKKCKALTSIPQVSRELALVASQISSSAAVPGGHSAQPQGHGCCFLPQALYTGHLLCHSSAGRSRLLHSGNCATSKKPSLIKRARPSLSIPNPHHDLSFPALSPTDFLLLISSVFSLLPH